MRKVLNGHLSFFVPAMFKGESCLACSLFIFGVTMRVKRTLRDVLNCCSRAAGVLNLSILNKSNKKA